MVVYDLCWWPSDLVLSAGKIIYAESYQSHFHKCSTLFPEIGCEMFGNWMAKKATTMSLSILVVVEMFNAMNRYSLV